jgi:ATP synthase protein I
MNRDPGRPQRGPSPPRGEGNPGWTVFSYLLSGMIFYGGIGWVIGHWVWHSSLFFPLGMLLGLLLAIILVFYRFGRPRP